jgi:hypothetical protein
MEFGVDLPGGNGKVTVKLYVNEVEKGKCEFASGPGSKAGCSMAVTVAVSAGDKIEMSMQTEKAGKATTTASTKASETISETSSELSKSHVNIGTVVAATGGGSKVNFPTGTTFTSASSYACSISATETVAVSVTQNSGSQITLVSAGPGTPTVHYICTGN